MNRNELIIEIVNNLRQLAKSIEDFIGVMNVDNEDKKLDDEQIKAEPITLEQVRAVLAEKSQSGKQPEVKALILKFGANKLTDINPSCFEELLKEAKVL
jgi:hypothetical protein